MNKTKKVLLSLLIVLYFAGAYAGGFFLCINTGGPWTAAFVVGIFGVMLGAIGLLVACMSRGLLEEWWDWLNG